MRIWKNYTENIETTKSKKIFFIYTFYCYIKIYIVKILTFMKMKLYSKPNRVRIQVNFKSTLLKNVFLFKIILLDNNLNQ